ncbi:MAG: phosphodiesterase [Desulfovibrio sp.]|nr:MAG: phosphodiesterase [Desulfovibrio sp.]
MHATHQPRLVVLGLDGLPYTLARDLCARGCLPNLARVFSPDSPLHQDPNAAPQPMLAELPELSPVNWTSFYTASGPEEHGVYGFTRINGKTYRISLADSTQVLAPTIFSRIGQSGWVSRVVNLPNTYPAQPMPGKLIAGFPAPDLASAVFPPPLLGPLANMGYQLEADTDRGGYDPKLLLSELHTTLKSRQTALDLLWPDPDWHLFVFVLTETDRLFHFLYPAVEDPSHDAHRGCMEFFQAWDKLVGGVLDRYLALPEPKQLMIMADHGFTRLDMECDLNVWLQQQGYLVLGPAGDHSSELDATRILPQSRAFALDPGRIYLHTQERFARGTIVSSQVPELLTELTAKMSALTWEGKPVMEKVLTAEQTYGGQGPDSGPGRALAPDLVCVPNRGIDLKAKFDRTELFSRFHRAGTHTATNAFFYHSAGKATRSVRDTGQHVLDYFSDHPTSLVLS